MSTEDVAVEKEQSFPEPQKAGPPIVMIQLYPGNPQGILGDFQCQLVYFNNNIELAGQIINETVNFFKDQLAKHGLVMTGTIH